MVRRMRRRYPLRWVSTAFMAVLVLVGMACGGGGKTPGETTGANPGELVFVSQGGTYGNAYLAAYLQPFENETGIRVRQVEGSDDVLAAVKTQVETGNVLWDIANCARSTVVAFPDLWEPIDRSIVKSTDDLVYAEIVEERVFASDVEAFPIFAYRTDVYEGTTPSSWADFFDTEKFPGPRAIPNIGLESATSMPAIALLADGVSPDQLIPYDLDRAYAKLDQLKPNIRVFWTGFSQSVDVIRLHEVDMTMATDGRIGGVIASGAPVAAVFNQGLRFTGSLCVPKGAPNKGNAFRFMEYILSHPKQQAIFSSLTYYGPPTNAGVEAAKALGVSDFSTLHTDQLIPDSTELLKYWEDNSDALLNRWNDWVGA
jgi:putative spermidine/putrescine transport system substrate-binding protein